MKLEDHINGATLEQARAWYDDTEKWCYCVDLMMISGHDSYSDQWVNALEERFDELLDAYRVELALNVADYLVRRDADLKHRVTRVEKQAALLLENKHYDLEKFENILEGYRIQPPIV